MTDLVIHVARWQGVLMVGEVLRLKRYNPGRLVWETEPAWPRPARQEGA